MSKKAKRQTKSQGIHLYVNSNHQYWWTLVARNGRTLATSETYTTKQSAVKGIKSTMYWFDDNNHYYDYTGKQKHLVVL